MVATEFRFLGSRTWREALISMCHRCAKLLIARTKWTLRSTSDFLVIILFSAVAIHAQNLSVAVEDTSGHVVAQTSTPTKKTPAILRFNHEYQPGDRIVVYGSQWIALKISDAVAECNVYLSPSAQGRFEFPIPFGSGEQNTGSAYPPDAFTGTSHNIVVRSISKDSRRTRHNLALNPCDRRTDSPVAFPHASTNSVSREAYNFDARNAIDGVSRNGHHGEWPYQSWGPLVKDDLWWKLDFGREVDIDSLRIMLRTDFPHDSYWKSAMVEFSDGSTLPLTMTASAVFQDFHIPKRRIRWLRLNKLISMEARWSGLIELEAWGKDVH
jgi:hypothetical protein